jgi:putative sigma-54 modulation protein
MNVNVHASFSISEKLQELTQQKIDKLNTFYDRITTVDVYFKDGANRELPEKDKTVEIKMDVPGQILFSEGHGDSYEKALAVSADKMRKLLLKFKEQISTF